MSAFTSGPWLIEHYSGAYYQIFHGEGTRRSDRFISEICIVSEDKKGDAYLISASPDMYAALKKVRETIGHKYPCQTKTELSMCQSYCELIPQIDAAIAKAEGV